MSFKDLTPSFNTNIDSSPDPTFQIGNNNDDSLGSFLERPVRVRTSTWGLNAEFNDTFDPWTLFLTDPAVKKRIDNYSLLRCKLCVKVVVNATPFHYGRAILSYNPFQAMDLTDLPVLGDQNLAVCYSQRPKIFIDPTTSTGGSMCLPFIHYDNWLDITDSAAIQRMGRLKFTSFQPLRHANDGFDNITVSVFVWATDVHLSVPTQKLSAQSGKVKGKYSTRDEYEGDGPVSSVATAIAKAAGQLEAVPMFKPFAFATRMGAQGISGIAKAFGFSRPPILDNISYMKPTYVGNLATCDRPEAVTKLTVDSKQELTLDPRTVGLDSTDEMTIKYITQKETFLDHFVWAKNGAPDDELWSSQVAPMLEHRQAQDYFYPTALSYATWPFRNWAGTIKFRFQVVASGFHHGRLRISYTPHGSSVDTLNAFNTVYTRIVDIGDEDDFELAVAWASKEPYKRTDWDKNQVHFTEPELGPIIQADPVYDNGIITVRILNELTSPVDTADISINVFVSAGDDFELCNPTDINIASASYFAPEELVEIAAKEIEIEAQSGQIVQEVLESNHPEGTTSFDFVGAETPMTDLKKQVFFGESIESFRTLLRRYNLNRLHFFDTASVNPGTSTRITWFLPATPLKRGFGGPDLTLAGNSYSYCGPSLINYLMPAYMGYRGSFRSKFLQQAGVSSSINAARGFTQNYPNDVNTVSSSFVTQNARAGSTHKSFIGNRDTGLNGSLLHPTAEQPCAEVEWPYMLGKRFSFARFIGFDDTLTGAGYVQNEMSLIAPRITDDPTKIIVDEYVSVGEDFNLFYFANAPPRWHYDDPAPSTGAP